jgi:hypothetical protein
MTRFVVGTLHSVSGLLELDEEEQLTDDQCNQRLHPQQ